MKKIVKTALIILPPVGAAVLIVILLITAFSVYEAGGSILLVKTSEHDAVTDRLDVVNIPYDVEEILYDGVNCLCIESRAELMPVIEEILKDNAVIPVYRSTHRNLFYTIVFTFSLAAVCCAIYGILIKKHVVQWCLWSAAFLCVMGGMAWLTALPLTL